MFIVLLSMCLLCLCPCVYCAFVPVLTVFTVICQIVIHGCGITVEWALSIVVPIFKRNGDIRNSSCYRARKLPEHGMKVLEMVLEKRLQRIVSVDEMQHGIVPERDN